MGKILGIDLGTPNSAGAVLVRAGENKYIARIVKEEESELNYIPSVVFFEEGKDKPIVGQRAKKLAIGQPERTVMLIGTKMGSDYTVNIDGKEYTPEMISSFILKRIKELVEVMIGEPITEAKISVPSIFDSAQKEATLEAAKSSHLFEKVDIMTEPIATAFACRDYYKVIDKNDQRLMVVDIGAGTTDIEIIDVSGEIFEVIRRTGDDKLGGDNINEEVVKYLKEEFKKQHKEQDADVNLIDDACINKDLRREAESAIIQLSTQRVVEIFVEIKDYFITTTLTRDKLEELLSADTDGKESVITRIRKEIRRALDESGLKKEDISKIALVGGPTNMPIIRELVKEEVGDWEEKVDPFTCVAIGAACSGLVIDISAFSYGLAENIMTDTLEEFDGKKIKTFTAFDEIIERGTILPAVGEKIITAEPRTKIPLCIVQDKYRDKKIYKVLVDYEYYLPIPEGEEEAEEGEEIRIKFTLTRNELLDVTAEDVRTGEKLKIKAKTKKRGEIIKLVSPPPAPPLSPPMTDKLEEGDGEKIETELKEFKELKSKGDLRGILGVSKDATQDEIKSGYEKLFRKYAPREEEAAVEILLIVNEAFTILKDPKTVEEHCKRAYIQKEVDKVEGLGRYHKKETIVNTLISDGEISGMDCAVLKRKGKSYLIDKIANELNPLDVYITKDESREGCTEIFIEQPSDRKIEVRIPAKTKNGEIIPIEGGKHFARVKVIPVDVDEIFEKIEKTVRREFQIDLGEFTSTQELKNFIRGSAKEQYRKDKRVNKQEIIEKIMQDLYSVFPKIKPFDVYITKDEYREGCTVTLVGQQPTGRSRKIDVRIPAYTEDGEIIPIEGGKVRVNVIRVDADEIFEKVVEKVRRKFTIDLGAVEYKVKSEIVGFIRNKAKEQYRKDKRVNEQRIIEDVIDVLPQPKPSKPAAGFDLAKGLIYLLIKYWWIVFGFILFLGWITR